MGLDNPLHIAFLVVVLLLVFGARRLPEIGRSLGSGMREFKSSVTGEMHNNQASLPAGAPRQQAPAQAQTAQAAPVAQAAAPAGQPAATVTEQPPGA